MAQLRPGRHLVVTPCRDHSCMPPSNRRIVICTDTCLPQINGVSIVTAHTVRGLTARGWEVALVGPRYRPDSPPDAAAVEHLALPSVRLPGYADIHIAVSGRRQVHDLVQSLAPDLIHCQTEFAIGRMGQSAGQRFGIPVVSSYHTDFSRYAGAYGVSRLRPVIGNYLSRFHHRSARVLTPSMAALRDLEAMGIGRGLVWGCGVDSKRFHPNRRTQELRESFGMGSRFTFLYVGRFAPEKHVELILEAFAEASSRVPRGLMHLMLAGTGPRDRFLRSIAPLGVSFLGDLHRDTALPDLYANADAFLFSSTTETLGLVVLEAMASGLPVVATPAGGVAALLEDGVNGIAFPANDAGALADIILRLASYPDERFALSAGARATAERLDWERELDRLVGIYEGVLAGDAASRRIEDRYDTPSHARRVASSAAAFSAS